MCKPKRSKYINKLEISTIINGQFICENRQRTDGPSIAENKGKKIPSILLASPTVVAPRSPASNLLITGLSQIQFAAAVRAVSNVYVCKIQWNPNSSVSFVVKPTLHLDLIAAAPILLLGPDFIPSPTTFSLRLAPSIVLFTSQRTGSIPAQRMDYECIAVILWMPRDPLTI